MDFYQCYKNSLKNGTDVKTCVAEYNTCLAALIPEYMVRNENKTHRYLADPILSGHPALSGQHCPVFIFRTFTVTNTCLNGHNKKDAFFFVHVFVMINLMPTKSCHTKYDMLLFCFKKSQSHLVLIDCVNRHII